MKLVKVFPTASTLRDQRKTSTVVHDEILLVENRILTANEAGLLAALIDDTNYTIAGTTAQGYFDVWKNTVTDRVLELQMDTVIKHFTDLGYSMTRKTNISTSNTFTWEILW